MAQQQRPGEPFYQNVKDIYLPDRVGHNIDILVRARTAVALFSGACAGILGLTGFGGFVVFLVGALLCDVFLSAISTAGGSEKYLPAPNRDFFTFGSLSTGVLSFIMSWLILYNVLFVF
jgi:hypothetical protein